jgi:hypothetical protein
MMIAYLRTANPHAYLSLALKFTETLRITRRTRNDHWQPTRLFIPPGEKKRSVMFIASDVKL